MDTMSALTIIELDLDAKAYLNGHYENANASVHTWAMRRTTGSSGGRSSGTGT